MKKYTFVLIILCFLGCSKAGEPLAPLPSKKPKQTIDKFDGSIVVTPQVDILFVIDDSGSMAGHQSNLATNIEIFVDKITETDLDYHIGVITSSDDGFGSCRVACRGELYSTDPQIKYVTPRTVDGIALLKSNLKPGIDGSATEKFFSPVLKALSEPLRSGKNAGFIRPNAMLAFVFITDTGDQSTITNSKFLDFLLKEKQDNIEQLAAYAVFLPDRFRAGCNGEHERPVKIDAFLSQISSSFSFSLCDPKYGDQLAKVADLLLDKSRRYIPLKEIPVVDTIQVFYGEQELKNDPDTGWVYDPYEVAIRMGAKVEFEKKKSKPGQKAEVPDFRVSYVPSVQSDSSKK